MDIYYIPLVVAILSYLMMKKKLSSITEDKRKGGKVKAQMIDTHQNHIKHTPVIIISVVV